MSFGMTASASTGPKADTLSDTEDIEVVSADGDGVPTSKEGTKRKAETSVDTEDVHFVCTTPSARNKRRAERHTNAEDVEIVYTGSSTSDKRKAGASTDTGDFEIVSAKVANSKEQNADNHTDTEDFEVTNVKVALGDVVLVSTEGVEFHVKANLLRTHSSVFRDMFDVDGIRESPVEETYADERTLRMFTRVLNLKDPPDDPKLRDCTRSCWVEVLKLCHRYDMSEYLMVLVAKVLSKSSIEPWYQFCLASMVHIPAFTKAIIPSLESCRELRGPGGFDANTLPEPMMSHCEYDYLIALLRAAAVSRKQNGQVDWSFAKDRFKLIPRSGFT